MGVEWLNDTEQRAWQGVVALTLLGWPELERTFRAYGLVHVEYGLLHELSRHPEGVRLCDLATGVNVSQSRLSHRMNKLLDRGLVDVRPSREDGRVSVAFITVQGRDLMDEIAPRHVADVRRLLFDHLTPAQIEALSDALGTVADHLDPATGCPGPRCPADG